MADKPNCGGTTTSDSLFWQYVKILGIVVGGIGGIATGLGWITDAAGHIIFTIGAQAFTAAIVAGAAAGAAITAGFIIFESISRLKSIPGIKACYAGIVTNIVNAFSSTTDTLFPFSAQHDRTDVVVKPDYWMLVTMPPSQWVWCNSDSMLSPVIRSYYFSEEIKGAAYGSIIGAALGALGGFIAGLAVGVAIGCAGGPILCAIALIVALLVAAAIVLVSAFIGGNVGRAITGASDPTGTPVGGTGSQTIGLGDYVSVNGNLVAFGEDNNAIVSWWVIDTTIHGRSVNGEGTGGGAPFNYGDARDNLKPDACTVFTDTGPVLL